MSAETEPMKLNADSSCQYSSTLACNEPKSGAATIAKLVLELKEQQNEQSKRIVNRLTREIDQLKQDKTLLSKKIQIQQEEIDQLKNNVSNLQDIIAENYSSDDGCSNLTRSYSRYSLNANGHYCSNLSPASSFSSLNPNSITGGSSSASAFEGSGMEDCKQEDGSVNPQQEVQELQIDECVRKTIAEIVNIKMIDVLDKVKKLRDEFEEERAIRIGLLEDLTNNARSQLESSMDMALNMITELNKK